MKPSKGGKWKNHPELVRLRERRSRNEFLALVAEVKKEMQGGPTRKKSVVYSRDRFSSPRRVVDPEYYYKMYYKNEWKPVLQGVRS